jgi:hypothetical protein
LKLIPAARKPACLRPLVGTHPDTATVLSFFRRRCRNLYALVSRKIYYIFLLAAVLRPYDAKRC